MSGSLNKVILVGNLGQDPDVRSMQNGDKVANLSIATSERWTKDGQKQEKTEWHRVVLFGKIAEVAERYLKKGAKVLIEGQLQTRKWDKDGVTQYSTEVVVRGFGGNLTMLDGPNTGDGSGSAGGYGGGYGGRDYAPDLDSEIPF